jgi:hypothetical protein
MSDFNAESLPDWATAELRRPVTTSAARRARIMELVREAPAPRRHAAPAFHPRWFRRGVLSPVGAALAAAFAGIMSLSGLTAAGRPSGVVAEAVVVGDTVITEDAHGSFASALCDTLRLVRFVLRAPGATRVALSGDFNAWSRFATPLLRDAKTGEWVARLALPRRTTHYAFVVDGARWVNASRFSLASTATAFAVDSI